MKSRKIDESNALNIDQKALASQRREAARKGPSRRRFLAGAAVTIGLPWLESAG